MTAPHAEDRAAVIAFVERAGRSVLATVAADGAPEASLVGIAAMPDGVLVADAADSARKLVNLRSEARIAIVAGTDGDVTVQIEGVARIAEGAERQELGAHYVRRFPGARALAPGFVVIAIEVRWVRVYDASTSPARVTEAIWDAAADGRTTVVPGADPPVRSGGGR